MKKSFFILAILIGCVRVGSAQYKLYEEGLAKYEAKEYNECISLLSSFLTKPLHDKKCDVDAYYYRALANFKSEKNEAAISDFQEALLLNRSNKGNIYW